MTKKHKQGFTLIEISVGTAVIVFIGLAIAGLQYLMTQSQVTLLTGSLNVDQANVSLSSLSRELRTARAGEQGAYLLESATDQSITFYSDIDYDGESEKVRYFLDGTAFRKGIIEPSGTPVTYPSNTEQIRTITENARNAELPVFAYFDEDTEITNNISEIRVVGIYLRLNTRDDDTDHDYVLETYANIRTLKENL